MKLIGISSAATRLAASALVLVAASFALAETAHPGEAPAAAASAGNASNAAKPGTQGAAALQGTPAGTAAPQAAPQTIDEPKSAPAPADVTATIKKALESRFKSAHVLDVQTTALPNMYEVYVGDRVVYSNPTGDYVIIGNLVDTRTRMDLSKMSMDRRTRIDYRSLPFDKAIKVVKGDGSRTLAVFEDPDCPYCQRLEAQLKSVTNLTEYVFLYPIDELHP